MKGREEEEIAGSNFYRIKTKFRNWLDEWTVNSTEFLGLDQYNQLEIDLQIELDHIYKCS